MRAHLIPVAVLSLALSACVEDVGKGKVKAEVSDVPAAEAQPAETPKAAPAGATVLKVDPAKSTLKALGAKITATHPIDFKEFEGMVTVKGDEVAVVTFTAQMESLVADHPKLTAHLKNEDFFHVSEHPTATFESVKVEDGWKDGGDWTHTVTGDFTIRGKTKRVVFPAKIQVGEGEVTASTEFVLNRQDFGITYPGKPDDLVQDNVRLNIDFVAPRS